MSELYVLKLLEPLEKKHYLNVKKKHLQKQHKECSICQVCKEAEKTGKSIVSIWMKRI